MRDGRKKFIESKTQYNIIKDYLAERTNDESGSYSVNPFQISVHNSLNDKLGGNGLFFEDQKTDELNTPSDDLMCVKVSPGKAYVEGYDVETTGTSILDVEKPRDTKNIDLTNFPFRMGNLLKVNNVAGTPTNNELLTLKNKHKSESTGVEIGKARVYTFGLTDAAYSGSSTTWNLYLYDIQTYTKFILNANISLPIHSHVKGVVSGATGFTVAAYSDKNLIYVTNTTGSFIKGEGLVINGNNDVKRSIKELESSTGNVYQTISVLSKRSNQINIEMKEELNQKLDEFATSTDNLEEIFENREQIEVSRYYERLPKSGAIAIQELEQEKIFWKSPETEDSSED